MAVIGLSSADHAENPLRPYGGNPDSEGMAANSCGQRGVRVDIISRMTYPYRRQC